MPSTPRDIVETDKFREQLKALEPNARRADEFIDGTKWVLAKNPRAGRSAYPGKSVRIIPVSDGANVDPMAIYYSFDSERIYLLSIEKTLDT